MAWSWVVPDTRVDRWNIFCQSVFEKTKKIIFPIKIKLNKSHYVIAPFPFQNEMEYCVMLLDC